MNTKNLKKGGARVMRVGVELEGFVFCNGKPVDVYNWLLEEYGEEKVKTKCGVIKTDAGKHLIEVALQPVSFNELDVIPDLVKESLEEVRMPKEWKLIFQDVDPRGLAWEMQEWAPKLRYKVIWEALKREAGEKWRGVLCMARLASTHIHFEVNLQDPKLVQVFNFFNMFFDMPNSLLKYASEQRINAWRGDWARKERLPYFRRWESIEEMENFWQSIPRLLRNSNSEWSLDLETFPNLGDPVAESTTWWWCRPRWSLGTIEIRLADSMPPEEIPKYVKEVILYLDLLL